MAYDWANIKGHFSPVNFFKICMTVENKNSKSLRQKENYTRLESTQEDEKQQKMVNMKGNKKCFSIIKIFLR